MFIDEHFSIFSLKRRNPRRRKNQKVNKIQVLDIIGIQTEKEFRPQCKKALEEALRRSTVQTEDPGSPLNTEILGEEMVMWKGTENWTEIERR